MSNPTIIFESDRGKCHQHENGDIGFNFGEFFEYDMACEIIKLKARIAELEAERPEVRTLALCEQEHVLLAPGHLYAFEIVPGCKACQRLAAQLDAPPAKLPVGDMPNAGIEFPERSGGNPQ